MALKLKLWQKLAIAGASAAAISSAMIVDWEGTVYTAHFDTYAKIWDICSGHTKGVKPGDTATQAQCDQYLTEDKARATADVARCIHVPLTEPQRAGFIVAAYNLPGIVCGSTLQRKANSGDVIGACPAWPVATSTRSGSSDGTSAYPPRATSA